MANPLKSIENSASKLLNEKSDTSSERADYRRNDQWVKTSFIVSNLSDTEKENRRFSSATFKYTDSSLGGNHCINPPPQFTRYADVPDKGLNVKASDVRLSYSGANLGMGDYYSEAIDDNNQIVHLRFGVPEYNSLTQFFTGFYNSSASNLARTGRYDQSFLEKFVRGAVGLITLAILPLLILPVAFMMAGSAFRYFMKWPSSKFSYLKPAMPLYWNAVTSLVNQLGIAKGIINYVVPQQYETIIGEPYNFTQEDYSVFAKIFPEFSKNGMLDVYAIANKSKRMEMRHRLALTKQLSGAGGSSEWFGKIRANHDEGGGIDEPNAKETTPFALESLIQKWLDTPLLSKGDNDGAVEKDMRRGKDISGMDAAEASKAMKDKEFEAEEDPDGYADFFLANAADGSEWASFRVDYTGPVQESFSNSTAPSTLAEKLNSVSSSARNLRINMAEGNIDSFGIVKTALDTVGTIASGVADVLQIGGLAAFAGNAFVDIPEHWESHSASLPKTTYTITLCSPYGNPVSKFLYIDLPLCMLLAGALPISTGKQSYQSPFFCELYDRGRVITRYGVIDNLSIQRGTSNLGFNNEGSSMAIEVSFSVKDLSSLVTLPISQGFLPMILDGIFDNENAFSDYVMALSGTSLRDATDRVPLLKMQLGRKIADIDSFFSRSHFASYTAGLPVGQLASLFMLGTEKE